MTHPISVEFHARHVEHCPICRQGDGVRGGCGRTASSLRESALIFGVVVACVAALTLALVLFTSS